MRYSEIEVFDPNLPIIWHHECGDMNEMKESKDCWDKMQAFGIILIPVVVVLTGYWIDRGIQEKEFRMRRFELAVSILQQDPKVNPEATTIREWAIDVFAKYSGVPLNDRMRQELKEKPLPTHPSSLFGEAIFGESMFGGRPKVERK